MSFPARIHILLARDVPIGVVIRRGPSKQVATFCWDRTTDEFRLGQWLKGRIYERRSDLSPDGKYLIYFAMNGKWTSEVKGSWTAISRTPYLKALGLYSKGDCWNGGGLWTGSRTYWLNDGYGHTFVREATEVRRDATFRPAESYGGECLHVYYNRLQRDGWTLRELGRDRHLFERPVVGDWLLRKIAHAQVGAPPGKGCYWDEHELVNRTLGTVVPCPTWEWAELDGQRLVWASQGKLYAGRMDYDGLKEERELYDFNPLAFAAIAAPY